MDDTEVTCPSCGERFPSATQFCPNDGSSLVQLPGAKPGGDLSASDLSGSVVADRYRVIKKLGDGAMGQVYLAEHLSLRRRVALKVMHPHLMTDRSAVARFNREAGVASQVNHPNVGATYDFGETDQGLVFLSMEFIEGQTLRRLVEESNGLPAERAANIMRQVAEGLAAAHRVNVVHRDLKPDNIIVARDHDGRDIAKIVDFGIAKSVASRSVNVTAQGFLLGTPTYMSPEQVSGDLVGPPSDIFSLGLVAFYLLTGRLAYPDGSVREAFIARLSGKPMSLTEARPDIAWPPGLQVALDRALAKNPADRYQVATDFGEAFAGAIAGEDVGAAPVATGESVATPPPERPLVATIAAPPPPPPRPAPTTNSSLPARNRSARTMLLGAGAVAALVVIVIVIGRLGIGELGSGEGGSPTTAIAEVLRSAALWIPLLVGAAAFGILRAFRSRRGISPAADSQRTATSAATSAATPLPPATQTVIDPPRAPRVAPPAAPPTSSSAESTLVVRASDWLKPETPNAPSTRDSSPATTGIFASRESAAASAFPLAIVVTTTVDPSVVGRRVKCDHFPFTVGRGAAADLSIPGDIHLSRIHIEVDSGESGFLLRDRSTNGVYVNGRMLRDAAEAFGIGTAIQLTVHTSLRFVVDVPMLPDLSGQLLDNRYRLTRRLHESVKSSTYLATDERIPRSLAVKVFSPVLMSVPQYRTEFRRQADLAARLQHPHICKVMDWGEATMTLDGAAERVAFLCSEYMGGGSLATRLSAADASNPAVVAEWIEKIASALQHAHDAGIVHGDVKPNCVLFDAHGTPYLADFALAVEGTSNTRTVVGNPEYLAPEQWDAQPPSPRSDQYSLAVLAYFLFCGVPPYEGQADPAVRRRNFERGPVPAHEEATRRRRDGVSRQVSAVLTRAMSVDAAARFESALEFSRALTRSISSKRNRTGATRIFLSYHRDTSAAWATHLSSALRDRHGYSVFLDTQSTDGAPKIPDRLKNEIRDCDVFVCLLGEKTLESKWVRQEIGSAAKFDKPMVPIFQEDFRPADAVTKTRPGVRRLLNYSGVHLFDRKNVYVDDMIAHLNEQIQRLVGGQ